MGGFHGEKEPRKATYANADAIKDIRHRLSYVSRRSSRGDKVFRNKAGQAF